ncbi:MAG: phosphatase PAP2 family protein [Limnochordaceae bacterium]|nr:phosphatase PAP2 family protein [Limnochordaceae bacterium]
MRLRALFSGARHQELALFWWIHLRWARQWLDRLMRWGTHLGSIWSCLIVGVTMWAFPTQRPLALTTTVAVAFSHLPVQILKHAVQRPRPYLVLNGYRPLVAPLRDHSFPSGHTTAAFAMAGVLSAAGPWVSGLVWPLAVLVGISRMYLGHHYPSDVLVGAFLGTFAAILSRTWILG